ncbi:DUF2064 domain-containing protein [Cellulomonas sp. JH27-2]|uniref:TIGR04282 family arsenosugar biosynthesis glycosyltransferase n=1 Tax=Cellulomonas sp. JH27-2 TaxID=2774139 RepID=UPI00177ED154|nr:DUF2064 domain-containing protein [Cellulomonas sp. JH27-2]MBD8060065.1 DUF2064 domain-containing protein [Cellulomonas sp. JH27-2]
MSAAERAGTLVLLAKEPVPGRVKTRLHAAFRPDEAARLAAAAIDDTLAALVAAPARRRLVALDGDAGAWVPPGFDVVRQPTGGLGDRLAAAFDAALADPRDGPALLVGMDTPQLAGPLAAVDFHGVDAVLGPTDDGGYWAIGLRAPDPRVFAGVPMSTDGTCAAQLARLRDLGLRVGLLPRLRDVDEPDDARAVAALAPHTRFAAAYHDLAPVHTR